MPGWLAEPPSQIPENQIAYAESNPFGLIALLLSIAGQLQQ
jgi:hypothetical protein